VEAWWPWLGLAGLGAFHGINPAMGWLFAVALGLHRQSGRIAALALLPIAAGHALAILAVVLAVMAFGAVLNGGIVRRLAGLLLIGWALWHAFYGHRHRVRVGMQTGLLGLGAWSFLMATAHGAGLMLVPLLAPLGVMPGGGGHHHHGEALAMSFPLALAAVTVHTLAMLLVIALVTFLVYRWLGVAFLRRGWINLDLLWSAALVLMGFVLLI
jgi:hypothetical protein